MPSVSALKSAGRLRFSSSTRFQQRFMVLAWPRASRSRSMSKRWPLTRSHSVMSSAIWAPTYFRSFSKSTWPGPVTRPAERVPGTSRVKIGVSYMRSQISAHLM